MANPSSSPITWWSPSGVSNSLIGLLDGDGVGWDLSCNQVSFFRVWSLVPTMFWDWCCYDFAMLNASYYGPSAMISDLNLLCFHEYMCVLDPSLQVYSHLLCVMIRQPRSDNNRILLGDDRSLRSPCIHYVLRLCSGTLLKGGLNIP